jgi:hypothetical protein
LVTGAYRGFMGALVKPLAYMLETSARVADNITAMVVGVPEIVPRLRPPRFVSAVQPLPAYDWSEVVPSAPLSETASTRHTLLQGASALLTHNYVIWQAIGRHLLAEVSEGRHSAEEFLICRQQSDGTEFVLLTSQHALCISWPGLRFFPAVKWKVEVHNILHVKR